MRRSARIFIAVLVALAAVTAALATLTQAGVFAIERANPPQGKILRVAGGAVHVVDIGPRDAEGPAIVMIHGATSTLGTMRVPLGDELAKTHRVILVDRPGHGWSERDSLQQSSPTLQAKMIDEALGQLGVDRAVIVVHSLAGALGALMPLNHSQRTAGLVMLAPVAYPWPGGVGEYNRIVTLPVIGPLLAYTLTLPVGTFFMEPGVRAVFTPQTPPPNYVAATQARLVLRPRNFLANAWDLTTLKAEVAAQSPRYDRIRTPVAVITGDVDTIVSPTIHSRRFAAMVPGAKLIVLPGVGHIVQNAAPELVVREIESMAAAVDRPQQSSLR